MLQISFRIISLYFLLIFGSSTFSAEKVLLNGDWKFQYGDDSSWSQVNIDDTNWPIVKVPSLIKQLHKKPTTGWYRLNFDAMVDIDEPQALMIEFLRHSDETWINGIRVGGKGSFEKPWHFTQTNPVELIRVYDIPAGFLKPKGNLLAIKVNIGFGNALGAMFPGGAGILRGNVYLGDFKLLKESEQKAFFETIAADVFFIAVGLIEIFIILFLLRNSVTIFPEFKWLLFTSLFMMLASAGHDVYYLFGFNAIGLDLIVLVSLLGMPMSVALYFWAQYQNVKLYYVQILFGFWALASIIIIIPLFHDSIKVYTWYFWLLLAVVFFKYALYCGFKGILIGKVGAISQLLAILIFIASIRTQWLPDNFYGHRNVQIGSLLYRYLLLFAYFQLINSMQLDYRKLSQRVVNVADDLYRTLARELHDGIGQHLASMKLQTKLAKLQSNNKHLQNIEEELDTSVSGLRRLLTGLHPIIIDQYNITEALKKEGQHLEKLHGIKVIINSEITALEKKQEHQIFRIFQECTNNVIKYAQASTINIYLYFKAGSIILKINDNGIGFDTNKKREVNSSGGLGLISLHERVSLLNGWLSIKSRKKKGTRIYISIPISKTVD